MENERIIFDALISGGFSVIATCAIMGNIDIESGGNPEAYNASEGAIGLAQWEGSRRTALQNYGAETDLGVQLQFLIMEAKERGNFNEINVYSDTGEAAAYWDSAFEVSSGSSRGARMETAYSFYSRYSGAVLPPVHTDNGNVYVVVSGDTLSGIGEKFGVDWHQIYDNNRGIIGNDPNLIYPGQVLAIPSLVTSTSSHSSNTYVVVSGDTLSGIGEKFGVDWHQIYDNNRGIIGNDPNLIYPGQVLVIPTGPLPATVGPVGGGGHTYMVVSGDTLSGIGEKFGVDWHQIYNYNQGVIGGNPDLIYPGQVLVIP